MIQNRLFDNLRQFTSRLKAARRGLGLIPLGLAALLLCAGQARADTDDFIFMEFDKENKAINFIKAVNKDCGYKKNGSIESSTLSWYYDSARAAWVVECLEVWGTSDAVESKKNRPITKEELAVIPPEPEPTPEKVKVKSKTP